MSQAQIATSITAQPLDVQGRGKAFAARLGGDCGAVASFTGLVRGQGQTGERLDTLTLEHYPGMTERQLAAVALDAGVRWQLLAVDICHRIGRLGPGDPIVHVQTAAAHRQAAFAACSHIVEQLKSTIPLWKKESGPGWERWVEPVNDQPEQETAT